MSFHLASSSGVEESFIQAHGHDRLTTIICGSMGAELPLLSLIHTCTWQCLCGFRDLIIGQV